MKAYMVSILLFFVLPTPVYAQIAETGEGGRVYLNQQLRYSIRRLNAIENYTINSLSGILDLNSGGTGRDLSANTRGSLWYDDGSNAFTKITPGTADDFLQTKGAGEAPEWTTVVHPTDGVEFISRTPWTATTNSGLIEIDAGVSYLVILTVEGTETSSPVIKLRFNTDGGSSYANEGENAGDSTEIDIATIDNTTTAWLYGKFTMTTVNSDQMAVAGEVTYVDTAGGIRRAEIIGHWDNSASLDDFEIETGSSSNGEVLLYKLNES